jgi:hypothetical protein
MVHAMCVCVCVCVIVMECMCDVLSRALMPACNEYACSHFLSHTALNSSLAKMASSGGGALGIEAQIRSSMSERTGSEPTAHPPTPIATPSRSQSIGFTNFTQSRHRIVSKKIEKLDDRHQTMHRCIGALVHATAPCL